MWGGGERGTASKRSRENRTVDCEKPLHCVENRNQVISTYSDQSQVNRSLAHLFTWQAMRTSFAPHVGSGERSTYFSQSLSLAQAANRAKQIITNTRTVRS